MSSTSFLEKEPELREHIEQYTIEIINNKETKFSHDQSAHDIGFAYKWNQSSQNQQRRPTKPNNHSQFNHAAHTPDACSVSPSLSSQSMVYQDIPNERSSKKRKEDSNISFSDNPKPAQAPTHERDSPVVGPKNSQQHLSTILY